jgi:sulfoxide reductase catalytic subunit YedY
MASAHAAGLRPPRRQPAEHHRNPTSRRAVTTYNNFYELGTDKSDPAENIHRLKPRHGRCASRAW